MLQNIKIPPWIIWLLGQQNYRHQKKYGLGSFCFPQEKNVLKNLNATKIVFSKKSQHINIWIAAWSIPRQEIQFSAAVCICLSIQLYSNFWCGNFKARNKDFQVLHSQVRLNKTLSKCFDVPYSFFFSYFEKAFFITLQQKNQFRGIIY